MSTTKNKSVVNYVVSNQENQLDSRHQNVSLSPKSTTKILIVILFTISIVFQPHLEEQFADFVLALGSGLVKGSELP